ncbi:hypothetical protein MHBO_003119 [Bonamia ostreae]
MQLAANEVPHEKAVKKQRRMSLFKRGYTRVMGAITRLSERTKRQRQKMVAMLVLCIFWLFFNLASTASQTWANGKAIRDSAVVDFRLGLFSFHFADCKIYKENTCINTYYIMPALCDARCPNEAIRYAFGVLSLCTASGLLSILAISIFLHVLITRKRLKGREKLAVQVSVYTGFLLNLLIVVLYGVLVYMPLNRRTELRYIFKSIEIEHFGVGWYMALATLLFTIPQLVTLMFFKI